MEYVKDIFFSYYTRAVTETDIQSIEKRLMQTMDMILMKKKRYVF